MLLQIGVFRHFIIRYGIFDREWFKYFHTAVGMLLDVGINDLDLGTASPTIDIPESVLHIFEHKDLFGTQCILDGYAILVFGYRHSLRHSVYGSLR